jgi:BNR/Asp-box repeat
MARSRMDSQTLYVGTEDFGFFITKDGGMTWSPSNSGLPALTVRMNFDAWSGPPLRPVQIDQAFFDGDPGPIGLDEAAVSVGPISVIDVDLFDPQKLYIGTQSQGIFRSVNGGGGWSGTNLNNQMVYAIIGDPFNASELYAGCDASSGALYLSLDGGASWNASNAGLTGLSVYALAADPTTSGLLYAGTSQGVYKSTNSAGSWAPLGLPGQAIWAVGVATSNPGTIYAGTSAGLAISKDGGVTWEVVTRGLINQEITSLVMNSNFLPQVDLIGTAGGSLYRHGFIAPIP